MSNTLIARERLHDLLRPNQFIDWDNAPMEVINDLVLLATENMNDHQSQDDDWCNDWCIGATIIKLEDDGEMLLEKNKARRRVKVVGTVEMHDEMMIYKTNAKMAWAVNKQKDEDINKLMLEIARLKRGDFTEEEFQELCHNFSEDDECRFKAGCEAYQAKLFRK